MNIEVINYLNKKFNCSLNVDYYNKIDIWRLWWEGFYEPFHRIRFENGKKHRTKDMYTMKMGKKVCEDWASILINDKTAVSLDNDGSEKFLLGDTENGGVFGSNNFWDEANGLMERMMWSGTAAVVIRLKNAAVDADGKFKLTPDARIDLNYIDADMIIPLTCDNGIITEAAFCSELCVQGKKRLYLEIHRLENNEYIIENHIFKANDSGAIEDDELPEKLPPVIHTGSERPWFAICKPAIVNPISGNNGLGCSVFYNAIDNLKGVDLAYNNFNSDIWLGQKKVFLSDNMLEEIAGEKVTPDEVNQQLFYYIATEDDGDRKGSDPFIKEHNPELRVSENVAAVQAQLDFLSFKVGFGTKHYQFNAGSIVTATQYNGDKQDLVQNAHKHFIRVESFLHNLVKTILWIGHEYINNSINSDAHISITFDQSPLIDENAEREQDRQDVRDKTFAEWEYRKKWRGESEEKARSMIDEINGSQNVDLGFEDGG